MSVTPISATYRPEPDAETITERVEVRLPDQMVAEQVAARLGLPKVTDAPMTAMGLWVWATLRRTQRLSNGTDAATFLNTCLDDVDPIKGESTDEDPTQPGPGGAPS